jgi:hypothetical protein
MLAGGTEKKVYQFSPKKKEKKRNRDWFFSRGLNLLLKGHPERIWLAYFLST